jgi:CHAT domain-containing protein/tetratricopeptide (TPR) repeat protein
MVTSAVRRAVALWALVLAGAACRHPERLKARDWPRGELRSGGGPVAAALRVGEVHCYRLPLAKGTLLRLEVDQQGIDAKVALADPSGALVLEVDRLIGDGGPELVLAVAQRTGVHTLTISGVDYGPGRYAARVEALRPATAADRRSAEAYRLFTGAESLPPDKAMASWTRARETWEKLGETALEAEALARIARQHIDRGEYTPATAELYREAAAGFERAGDSRWEAIARHNLAAVLIPLAKPQEAAREATRALTLARQTKDQVTAAQALHDLGQAAQDQGDLQTAFDRYNDALALFQKNDRALRPYTLNNLGVLYARQFGDEGRGRELLLQARDAWPPRLEKWRARTLSQLGWIASKEGRLEEAWTEFEAALALRRESDPCGSAVLLARIAQVEDARRARPDADARLAEALHVVETQSCPRSAPTVYQLAAELAEGRGDDAAAQAAYRRSEELFAAQGDRLGVADGLDGLARSARALGDLPAALEASRRALDIIEGVRPTVLREDLRTSFFAAARDRFDFHVDLLMQMGKEEDAWVTAERARARALRDLLGEAGAGLRRDAAPDLAVRERDLLRQLNALESRRLATGDASAKKLRKWQTDIATRVTELESLRGELRRRSPRWASLTRTDPVSLDAVRQELLDDDTVLLEYRLGEPESTVWAVTRDSFTAARLPPRHEIEPLAMDAVRRLRSLEWPGHNPPALCELSGMLLAPVTPALAHRRLVVVADGALEILPFAALPEPADPASCAAAPLLVDRHEIAYLPSAATLLTQRLLHAGRRPAPGWLAVVDDPVYGPEDPRLGASATRTASVLRGGSAPRRLPGSGEEAKAILAELPAGKTFRVSGFAASRQTVERGALQNFRILHFATHGILDDQQPLLSSLALSRLDATGRPVEGDLAAVEIYDLDLPAELVTLSACETALGREVSGEGLVSGLPRAFLYAGASRVVVSLWPVGDLATRDLMTRFYHGLFAQGLAPARALQEAQRALRQSGRRPREWAGFVLLGDWRPLPPFSG